MLTLPLHVPALTCLQRDAFPSCAGGFARNNARVLRNSLLVTVPFANVYSTLYVYIYMYIQYPQKYPLFKYRNFSETNNNYQLRR